MSTRSYIAMRNADTTYTGVYCHWDGAPRWNGRILHTAYTSADRITDLLQHGSLSSLGVTIGRRHPFSAPVTPAGAQCIFYHRDRSDAWHSVKPFTAPTYDALAAAAVGLGCDWLHLWSGRWAAAPVYLTTVGPLQPLADLPATIAA